MTYNNNISQDAKISSVFNARLSHLNPQQKVRAIIVLHIRTDSKEPGHRQSRNDRKEAMEMIRASSEQALVEINNILKKFDGKLLSDKINALGSIPIETTKAGINAIAASKYVKAILEDQRISALPVTQHS